LEIGFCGGCHSLVSKALIGVSASAGRGMTDKRVLVFDPKYKDECESRDFLGPGWAQPDTLSDFGGSDQAGGPCLM
jgi:hypothetical protein